MLLDVPDSHSRHAFEVPSRTTNVEEVGPQRLQGVTSVVLPSRERVKQDIKRLATPRFPKLLSKVVTLGDREVMLNVRGISRKAHWGSRDEILSRVLDQIFSLDSLDRRECQRYVQENKAEWSAIVENLTPQRQVLISEYLCHGELSLAGQLRVCFADKGQGGASPSTIAKLLLSVESREALQTLTSEYERLFQGERISSISFNPFHRSGRSDNVEEDKTQLQKHIIQTFSGNARDLLLLLTTPDAIQQEEPLGSPDVEEKAELNLNTHKTLAHIKESFIFAKAIKDSLRIRFGTDPLESVCRLLEVMSSTKVDELKDAFQSLYGKPLDPYIQDKIQSHALPEHKRAGDRQRTFWSDRVSILLQGIVDDDPAAEGISDLQRSYASKIVDQSLDVIKGVPSKHRVDFDDVLYLMKFSKDAYADEAAGDEVIEPEKFEQLYQKIIKRPPAVIFRSWIDGAQPEGVSTPRPNAKGLSKLLNSFRTAVIEPVAGDLENSALDSNRQHWQLDDDKVWAIKLFFSIHGEHQFYLPTWVEEKNILDLLEQLGENPAGVKDKLDSINRNYQILFNDSDHNLFDVLESYIQKSKTQKIRARLNAFNVDLKLLISKGVSPIKPIRNIAAKGAANSHLKGQFKGSHYLKVLKALASGENEMEVAPCYLGQAPKLMRAMNDKDGVTVVKLMSTHNGDGREHLEQQYQNLALLNTTTQGGYSMLQNERECDVNGVADIDGLDNSDASQVRDVSENESAPTIFQQQFDYLDRYLKPVFDALSADGYEAQSKDIASLRDINTGKYWMKPLLDWAGPERLLAEDLLRKWEGLNSEMQKLEAKDDDASVHKRAACQEKSGTIFISMMSMLMVRAKTRQDAIDRAQHFVALAGAATTAALIPPISSVSVAWAAKLIASVVASSPGAIIGGVIGKAMVQESYSALEFLTDAPALSLKSGPNLFNLAYTLPKQAVVEIGKRYGGSAFKEAYSRLRNAFDETNIGSKNLWDPLQATVNAEIVS